MDHHWLEKHYTSFVCKEKFFFKISMRCPDHYFARYSARGWVGLWGGQTLLIWRVKELLPSRIQDLDCLIKALTKQSLTFFFFKFNQRSVEHGLCSQRLDQTDDKSGIVRMSSPRLTWIGKPNNSFPNQLLILCQASRQWIRVNLGSIKNIICRFSTA